MLNGIFAFAFFVGCILGSAACKKDPLPIKAYWGLGGLFLFPFSGLLLVKCSGWTEMAQVLLCILVGLLLVALFRGPERSA